jgi:hypothetical protein
LVPGRRSPIGAKKRDWTILSFGRSADAVQHAGAAAIEAAMRRQQSPS